MAIHTHERIKYYDTLRFLAILGIIILHVSQVFHDAGLIGDKVYSLSEITRFAVPVFLMMTGALLLNRDIELGDFFKRRFTRIIYPFILFLVIHRIVFYIIGVYYDPSYLNQIFSLPFSYNWYFWLIVGVYFFIPILNKVIQNSSMKELEYFVLVILGGSLFYQIMLYLHLVHSIDLSFFIGPISFVVVGYYLSVKEFDISVNKIITIALAIFIITSFLKIGGQLHLPYNLFHDYQATKTKIIKSSLDLAFVQLLQAGSLFVMIKYVHKSTAGLYSKIRQFLENNIINKFITSVSKASYGMYLMNNTFKLILGILLTGVVLSKPSGILLWIATIIAVGILSWLIVVMISKIPYLGKWSGYH